MQALYIRNIFIYFQVCWIVFVFMASKIICDWEYVCRCTISIVFLSRIMLILLLSCATNTKLHAKCLYFKSANWSVLDGCNCNWYLLKPELNFWPITATYKIKSYILLGYIAVNVLVLVLCAVDVILIRIANSLVYLFGLD